MSVINESYYDYMINCSEIDNQIFECMYISDYNEILNESNNTESTLKKIISFIKEKLKYFREFLQKIINDLKSIISNKNKTIKIDKKILDNDFESEEERKNKSFTFTIFNYKRLKYKEIQKGIDAMYDYCNNVDAIISQITITGIDKSYKYHEEKTGGRVRDIIKKSFNADYDDIHKNAKDVFITRIPKKIIIGNIDKLEKELFSEKESIDKLSNSIEKLQKAMDDNMIEKCMKKIEKISNSNEVDKYERASYMMMFKYQIDILVGMYSKIIRSLSSLVTSYYLYTSSCYNSIKNQSYIRGTINIYYDMDKRDLV